MRPWCGVSIVALFIVPITSSLFSTVGAQEGPGAWIHLSEDPTPPSSSTSREDFYRGRGPELYAFLVIDGVQGDHVSALECAHWLTIEDSSIVVDDFSPLVAWQHDTSPPEIFLDWPALPGQVTPAVLGYWTLHLQRERRSRAQIGLGSNSEAGIEEPLVLTETGRAVPLAYLWGAGINMEPPEPFVSPVSQSPVELTWTQRQHPKDIPAFHSSQPNQTILLRIRYPGRAREGEFGIVVRGSDGLVVNPRFHFGSFENPNVIDHGWIESSYRDDIATDGGVVAFRLPPDVSSRETVIGVPIHFPAAEAYTISVPWIIFEAPGGIRDTVCTEAPEAIVTTLGGVESPRATSLCWSPHRIRAEEPFDLRILGEDLQTVEDVALASGHEICTALDHQVGNNGRSIIASFPAGVVSQGLYRIQLTTNTSSDLTHGGVWAGHAAGAPEGGRTLPDWVINPGSILAEYVIVAPDDFYAAAEDLEEVLETYRALDVIRIKMSDIREFFVGAIPDSADALSIKQALGYAYEYWGRAPLFALLVGDAASMASELEYDLLPTHYVDWSDGTDPEGGFDFNYPMDSWFGDVANAPDDTREIAVGRLPVRSADGITLYKDKLLTYQNNHQPQSRVVFVVGDANTSDDEVDNHFRRAASVQIKEYIKSVSSLDTTSVYALDHIGDYDGPGWPHDADVGAGRDAVVDLIDSGADVVHFTDNTLTSWHIHVSFLLWYNWASPGTMPQFYASTLANTNKLPLVFIDHCDGGAFDEYKDQDFAPAEDFVLGTDPDKGAIAAVGRGDKTFFEADEAMAQFFYEELLEGSPSGSCIGYQVNSAVERYLQNDLCWRSEFTHVARQTNLIGDPSVSLKLVDTPRTLQCGFETSGAMPHQNAEPSYDWMWLPLPGSEAPCRSRRVVHAGYSEPCCGWNQPDDVFPVEGQRMFRMCTAFDGTSNTMKDGVVLFESPSSEYSPLLRLSPDQFPGTTILSYWVYQDRSVDGEGRAIVDLVTSYDEMLSYPWSDCVNQYGEEYLVTNHYPLGEWQHVWVRLDPWVEDERAIHQVGLRFVEPGSYQTGGVLVFTDAIFVGPWKKGVVDTPGNMILNGMFTEDQDRNGRPDFWTGPHDNLKAGPAATLFEGGDGSALLAPEFESPAVMTQLLPSLPAGQDGCFNIMFKAMSCMNANGSNRLRVKLRRLADSEVVGLYIVDLEEEWTGYERTLHAEAETPYLLEFEATAGYALVDDVQAVVDYCTALGPQPAPAWTTDDVRVESIAKTGAIGLKFRQREAREWEGKLCTPDGRIVRTWRWRVAAGQQMFRLDIDKTTGPSVGSGIYFLRLKSGSLAENLRVAVIH